MKKYFALCLVFIFFASAATNSNAWWWSKDDTPYVTSENTNERAAEDIIRDVWETKVSWKRIDESLSEERVVSIRTIAQVDGSKALDMRIRLDSTSTESEVIYRLIRKFRETLPKLLADNKLSDYKEFRIFGSLPMSDKYGRTSEDNVCKIFFTRSVAEKIQWDKFNDYGLHHLFLRLNNEGECTYWIHGGILSKAKYLK